MVSIMDVETNRQVCDNRIILSQSAVTQKSIDLDISPTADSRDKTSLASSVVDTSTFSTSILHHQQQGPCSSSATHHRNALDTDLAKRSMKLNLVDSSAIRSKISVASPSTSASASTNIPHSTTSTSVVTSTTTAIIMKHRKLKERTFSDEVGSPKSPASTTEVVDDRKALRDALYQGIFHRHRRTIFAVGSFLRMLKSRNSSYNTIRSSSEGEDDTK
ncbi:uncharacterized protein LOC128721176 [Anopheles nili]|uniref:uncharacterized protein LOC128721176 n=1 Tax=Anopheles nili TaxID=185578 RepID=UPI00237B3CB6|nr:uncharacterized protein LOC128721176 [Anopheles nili]